MCYLRLFIGADEAVSSTSRPEEFSSPHTNMYFTNVLFPEPPMFELNNWNSDLFFDKSTTEYSSKLSSLNTIVLSFAFSSNYHLEGLSEISYNQWFYQLWIFIWKISSELSPNLLSFSLQNDVLTSKHPWLFFLVEWNYLSSLLN